MGEQELINVLELAKNHQSEHLQSKLGKLYNYHWSSSFVVPRLRLTELYEYVIDLLLVIVGDKTWRWA